MRFTTRNVRLGRLLLCKCPWIYAPSRAVFRRLYHRLRRNRAATPAVDRAALIRQYGSFRARDVSSLLRDLGIAEGQTLMVHSSLWKMHSYQGTCAELIDALMSVVGSNGTLCMPAFPAIREKDASGAFLYDVRQSPSTTGMLTEMFRRLPGVLRSRQTRAVAAYGPLAQALVGDHHKDVYPCGEVSPYARFAKVKAKVLCIGISASQGNTMCHCAEDLLKERFPVRVYLREPARLRVTDEAGDVSVVRFLMRRPQMDFLSNVHLMAPYFRREVETRSLCGVEFHVVDAAKYLDRVLHLSQQGITSYGYWFPPPEYVESPSD